MTGNERGSTLIELLVVVAVLLPILTSINQMNMVVTRTVHADDRAADVTENLRKTAQRIGGLLRPGRLSSVQIQANVEDVKLALAAKTGEWISPTDLSPRNAIQFEAAEGLLSMNAAQSTPQRRLIWRMDRDERDNGIDDDDDGLVDEGELVLWYGAVRVPLASHLELCEFTTDGRMVRVNLRAGKTDTQGRTYRASIEQAFYLRNN